jgi:hypothetical protein
MNRLYTQFRLGLEKRVVDLYAVFAVGATGAPTLNAGLSKGIASVARNSSGLYTITLQDAYIDALAVIPTVRLASGTPASRGMIVRSVAVSGATPTVQVLFTDAAGAAVELNDGSVVSLKLELKASSV